MLRDDIMKALNEALKAQDKVRLSTLRLIMAALKDRDIANRGEGKDAASDTDIQALLARMIKQREESAKMYDQGGRAELAQTERQEITIIQEFLPQQLTADEAKQAIEKAVEECNAQSLKDMGKVMAYLKERYLGRMDFSQAGALVREKLK